MVNMFFALIPLLSILSICKIDLPYALMNDRQHVRRDQISDTNPSAMAPISKDQMNTLMRAEYIKKRIEKNKKWRGGHSPIPSRVITMETIKAVKQEISMEDSDALIILLQDDAYEIRSTAASLLGCVNPSARSEIEKVMATEMNSVRQFQFQEALITIDSIRDARTSCE